MKNKNIKNFIINEIRQKRMGVSVDEQLRRLNKLIHSEPILDDSLTIKCWKECGVNLLEEKNGSGD